MRTLLIALCIEFVVLAVCFVLSRKYRNPYKLVMIFGKKGSGKTTLLVKLAFKYMRAGRKVYSTFYIPGTYLFNVDDIGRYQFEPESVIIVDEVGMIWDNRQYKNFRTDVRDWFKLQRQYRNIVILASQTFDIDIKLRNLTDQMFLCRCYMGFLTIARRIKRDIVIVKATGDNESRIADNLEFEPFWLSLFGFNTMIITYIPRWGKVFKSFNPPALEPMSSVLQEMSYTVRKYFRLPDPDDDIPFTAAEKHTWKAFWKAKGKNMDIGDEYEDKYDD